MGNCYTFKGVLEILFLLFLEGLERVGSQIMARTWEPLTFGVNSDMYFNVLFQFETITSYLKILCNSHAKVVHINKGFLFIFFFTLSVVYDLKI